MNSVSQNSTPKDPYESLCLTAPAPKRFSHSNETVPPEERATPKDEIQRTFKNIQQELSNRYKKFLLHRRNASPQQVTTTVTQPKTPATSDSRSSTHNNTQTTDHDTLATNPHTQVEHDTPATNPHTQVEHDTPATNPHTQENSTVRTDTKKRSRSYVKRAAAIVLLNIVGAGLLNYMNVVTFAKQSSVTSAADQHNMSTVTLNYDDPLWMTFLTSWACVQLLLCLCFC